MVYVRIINVEALKLLARPITEFFSAHLIKIGPLHAFFCLLSQAVFMLPLRWLRRLMTILHACLSVLHGRMQILGGLVLHALAKERICMHAH